MDIQELEGKISPFRPDVELYIYVDGRYYEAENLFISMGARRVCIRAGKEITE